VETPAGPKDITAAIIAFNRHWLRDTMPGLDAERYKVLLQVMKKYQ